MLNKMSKVLFKRLPLDQINELFVVDEKSLSGLTWKISPSRAVKAGCRAGTLLKDGYYQVRFNKKGWKVHRVIWALAHQKDPGEMEIDHIDRNRQNNKIENLRLVTRHENFQNKKNQSHFGAGIRFLTYKTCSKYVAVITINKQMLYLGSFDTKEKAVLARQAAYEKSKTSLLIR